MAAAGRQRQRRGSQQSLLERVNDATKWAVSTVAFGTLLARRDLLAAWCILGSIVAAVNCRVGGSHIKRGMLGGPCRPVETAATDPARTPVLPLHKHMHS